jgi:hypothetical protein
MLSSLRTADVDCLIADLEAEGKAPGTVRNIVGSSCPRERRRTGRRTRALCARRARVRHAARDAPPRVEPQSARLAYGHAVAGHSSPLITLKRYSHLLDARLTEAAERFDPASIP